MKRSPMEDTPINFSNFHPAPGRRLHTDRWVGVDKPQQAAMHHTIRFLRPVLISLYPKKPASNDSIAAN